MEIASFGWPIESVAAVCIKEKTSLNFWHQFNEKSSIIPGCPVCSLYAIMVVLF